MYRCPLCHQTLILQGRSWQCSSNHHFDVAKEGYVNLLPVQHKRSKQPGDNHDMMQARRAFLQAGYYQPLVNALCTQLSPFSASISNWLDIGCGEGYYTAAIAQTLGGHGAYGLDIAKVAIRYAAKHAPEVRFCVASAYDLPFISASMDLMTRIFAPSKLEEIQRVLKPGGYFLSVEPAADHLIELKQAIYTQPRLHTTRSSTLSGFDLVSEQRLTYPVHLADTHSTRNLIEMTPFAWKCNPQQKHALATSLVQLTCDFRIRGYRKH
ncbi:MAG: 23S rRNA (guanine(745)-N(1))-methyltransferase [Thiomicrospira sp.]|jgi:23S rRNA (guanine745-N1)-methyltransferase